MVLVYSVFDLVSVVFDESLYGPSSCVSQSANSVTLDLLG